jgi:hypothetical protein
MIHYGFIKKLDIPYETVIEPVRETLRKEGFGVLTETDIGDFYLSGNTSLGYAAIECDIPRIGKKGEFAPFGTYFTPDYGVMTPALFTE